MRRPDPKKPHFFTFVCPVPPSCNGSVIPESFIHKYLKGEKIESALLRRGGRRWAMKIASVKINGTMARIFAKGWDKFEKDNGLELGDFIVFRHEGHLVFEVLVFNRTMCERQVPPPNYLNHGMKEVDLAREEKKSPPEANTLEEPTPDTHEYLKKIPKGNEAMNTTEAKATSSKLKHPPYYVSTLTPCNVGRSILYIPKEFAKSNGLWNRHCEMILRDEKHRSWRVKLSCTSSHVCIGEGWRNFRVTNGLKEGDEFLLELIENGDKPIMNFSRLNQENRLVGTHVTAEAPTSVIGKDLQFAGTLKPYIFKRSQLAIWLPRKFARLNGLTSGDMILQNGSQKTWPVELKSSGADVYIGNGWKDFLVENDLNEGHGFKFELIENVEKPIAKFTKE